MGVKGFNNRIKSDSFDDDHNFCSRSIHMVMQMKTEGNCIESNAKRDLSCVK